MLDFLYPHLPVLVVVVPLLTALLVPLLARIWRGTGAGLLVAALGFSTWGATRLLLDVLQSGEIVYELGGWAAPAGIPYVIDRLNAMVLLMVAAAGFLTSIWMWQSVKREIAPAGQRSYNTVFLLFATGLLGITITGDIFNLYVFLEIASITSYVLIAMGRNRQALYAGFSYLILGSLGATFILLGIGHLYMATGTLAMADVAEKLQQPGMYDSTVVRTAFAFFTVGLAMKMALFPLHGWQPAAYTHAPSGASLFIAATSTKIAAYAFYRVSFKIFGANFLLEALPVMQDAILVLCVCAIVIGPLMALGQDNLKRLLAYSSVGQIGYIMLGVVLFEGNPDHVAGPTGGLMHFWNHAAAKGALFCVAGVLVYRTGSAKVSNLAGLARKAPWTAGVATVAACSMIGVPLTAGFWSKFHLAHGALQTGRPIIVVVLLISSLLTAVYCWRILSLIWFAPAEDEAAVTEEAPWSMRIPSLVLGAACVLLFFFPVHYEIARQAVEGFVK